MEIKLNSAFKSVSIHFIKEIKENGKIPSLDCLLTRENNTLRTTVYRKPAHTDRLLDQTPYFTQRTPIFQMTIFNRGFFTLRARLLQASWGRVSKLRITPLKMTPLYLYSLGAWFKYCRVRFFNGSVHSKYLHKLCSLSTLTLTC